MRFATFLSFSLVVAISAPRASAQGPSAPAPVATTPAAADETIIRYLSGRGVDDAVEWDFMVSDGRRAGEWTKIRVPSCWEVEGFGTYQFGMPYYGKPNPPGIAKEQGKYRHTFTVPAEWRGRRVRIVFEGSMTDTHVRVNGISTGEAHRGGFYRFRRDVTDLLRYGGAENQIEITVDKESANESVNLAERRADYWNFGGIFRPVFLEALPARFIERSAIDARADGAFRVDVFLGASADPGLTVEGQLIDAAGTPVGAVFSAPVTTGNDRITLRTQLAAAQVRAWTAETPHLYRVRLALKRGAETLHTTTERFGFRTFEVRAGDGLYLNGQRILLRGVNRHSFRPESGRTLSRELNIADVRLIKELNMNAVRLSHYPADPEFLDACDELGLYVLNELGGWHGKYDTGVGRPLVASLVQRDVNHPSVIFWDNGNEGGWNTELDAEFGRWDPQNRPVLHPQKKFSGVETMHYRSYGEMQEYFRGPDIFMPTEFLHALYDGGAGAGLHDYWEMMRKHPRAGGGFIWALADEGLVRGDQGGRIDNAGNYAPDGIVGPRHEREGSFHTVRQVWSPVQITAPTESAVLGELAGFGGTFTVENRYDFTDLARCTFRWELVRFPATGAAGAMTFVASADLPVVTLAPQAAGALKLALPANWREADALRLTARGPSGEELWTWSWSVRTPVPKPAPAASTAPASKAAAVSTSDDATHLTVTAGALALRFDKATGRLAGVVQAGQPLSLGNGPRFIAARRGNRTLDGSVDAEAPKGVDRIYNDISGTDTLKTFRWRADGADVVVEATYFGALREVTWRISPDGAARVDYAYGYDGVVELMGVQFDYPETAMRSIRWVGRGPFRAWQNRLHGTTLGVWENAYNDPIPGESFIYPEFKGYFHDWRWATFTTAEGALTVENGTPRSFLGVYTPRDGRDALLYTFPQTGLAVFDVIPAVRNKVNATDLVGPSSQAQRVEGVRRGSLTLRFNATAR